MKYRIISKRTVSRTKTSVVPYCVLPEKFEDGNTQREKILLDSLFELATLPEVSRPRKIRQRKKLFLRQKLHARLGSLERKLEQTQKHATTFYTRVLFGVWGVTGAIALITLFVFFGKLIIPHSTLRIPSFVGMDVSELENTEEYELIISYESHDELAAGTVISQTPPMDTERKLFPNSGACKIFLSVSAGKHFYSIPSLTGLSRRDALLLLRSEDIPVRVVTQHSDTVAAGYVIDTLPPPDQKLFEGETLTLRVSLGKAARTVYVPSLFGLSETEASAAIRSAGLTLGKITYQSSDIEAGKVIAQQYTPFSQLTSGKSIDITVSLGNAFTQKYIPELYGLTVEEAAEKLGAVGLVIGNIYAVSSGAPAGTVISQSILPSTPITSNITSVDIYVSS